jgi:CubicO group peptidase (beta-lactamase class C family)
MKTTIVKLSLCILCINILSACSQNTEAPTITKIKKYLEQSEKKGLSGALLIAKEGKILLNEGFGYSDKSKKNKNTPTTVFDIGSVSKQFTAAAILKLEEQGKLKVEDLISAYFINVPKDKQTITIHQLLTHTAGFVHDVGESDFDQIPTDEYFKRVMNSTLLFTPGKKFEYTNVGYSILARIIELTSGQTYENYLQENLFRPSGMKYTGYLIPNWSDLNIANGYTYNVIDKGTSIDKHKKNGEVSWCLKGNGGIQSSQEDMYKWYQALSSNTILSKESVAKLITPYILEYEGETSYYAYGWAIYKTSRKTKMITHDGSDGTFYYDFKWLPEERIAILYATNALTRNIQDVAWEVEKMLFDPTYIPKKVEVYLLTKLLKYTENYTGSLDTLGVIIKEKFKKGLHHPYYLNRMCGMHMRSNQLEKAMVFAKLNVELFPKNANNWDTLGEVYYKNGNTIKALEYYQKALRLDPQMETAKVMVKKITTEIK